MGKQKDGHIDISEYQANTLDSFINNVSIEFRKSTTSASFHNDLYDVAVIKEAAPKMKRLLSEDFYKYKLLLDVKSEYDINECLECFNNLYEKNIGEIYLSGSVSLFIQGKITRNLFNDLDVVVVGDYSLDDDMDDRDCILYKSDPNGTKVKNVIFNNVKLDIFSEYNSVDTVNVEYNGKNYPCQSYKQIVKAKLNVALAEMKDYKELIETSFNILYK